MSGRDNTDEPAWLLRWLWAMALSCVLMVALGGLVRLTHSGLSMVDWQPVSGVLPPLSSDAWQAAFDAYQQTPEYQQVNAGMSLADFQMIFWPEFIHRILGRIVGLIVAVPLIVGLLRGLFPGRLRIHLVGIGLLFVAQGVMGWLMVKSGLVDDPKVSPYRLALHLALALTLLAWCLWLIFERRWPPAVGTADRSISRLAQGLLAVVVVQILFGALVAGHRAGYVSATFPKIHGHWIPEGLGRDPSWWANIVANPLTLHFEHRWLAFVALALAFALYYRLRQSKSPATLRRAGTALLCALHLQIALGIATILTFVPIWLASLHQMGAIAVLGCSWLIVQQTRR
ncbi:MAG TPA: COX15/CtaA family protein [Candidatus Latescibacteria bacterium]|jgi:cytochrome c oxidase assembly protein subunit 15|nr:heme A synthase [Gemmatimonadaceae bacterium]MDP6017096.1 COX15/CtaA family protein [Candidatus Latescibacterota bacterium]HJP33574.1 COX15/CtaA family protein [Candidatus Latescibacterota bacterium]